MAENDSDAYRRTCTALLDLNSTPEKAAPGVANDIAWTCSVGPDAVSDFTRVLELSQKAHAENPKEYAILNTLGTALYRAGRFQEAIERLTAAMSAHGHGGTAQDWLVLAMANHRLGDIAEAEKWFKKSADEIDDSQSEQGRRSNQSVEPRWDNALEIRLLHREAERTLRRE